ncbi:unnamed protein product [Porites evermanni]|uniref:Breast cancer metastasis-suppressor 1-like protein n=1 Tax=Porites evermanni TaxID=104178 RepID=A0ABN8SGL2_9CNID|nr:unnamed protein product [Porites evermanni]
MPSVEGEENGEDEVERSPNEDENMSEDEDEESSLSSDESSSESSIDETENERRRNECLNDMADLERQFSDLKEQLYRERISQVEKKLNESLINNSCHNLSLITESAMEYTGPVNELKEMCEIRIEVAGILRDCRLGNVKHKYDADEQAAIQHFESEKLALMESMKQELEEKIRKLEEDKQNMDISADIWLESQSLNKKHRKSSDGSMISDKRRKPVTVTDILFLHPYIVYMLREMDILEDWAAIRKAKGALARRRQNSGCQLENSPFSARYEDGKLYYEGEWFHKGDHILIESRNDTHSSAFVTGINTGEVWVRKGDGSKTKLYIGQLQKGKYKIRKT